jgi:hypothetical protein
VSKKSKPRRGTPARTAPASKGQPGHAPAGKAPARQALSSRDQARAEALVETLLSSLWEGKAGTTVLMQQVPHVLSRFAEAYDNPAAATIRGYASGLATSDADVARLAEGVGWRMLALPVPERHAALDLTDPADRRGLVAAESGPCTPSPGLTSEGFVQAACHVVEEMWRDDDNPTQAAARRLFAEGSPGTISSTSWPARLPRR